MTVHMHWVCASCGMVVHNEADRFAVAEIDYVGFSGIYCVADFRFQEERVVVVGSEGGVIHEEQVLGGQKLAKNSLFSIPGLLT